MFSVIIVFLSAVFALLYWYLTSTFDYWKKRNVVYEKPYVFVGTVGNDLRLKEHPGICLQKIYNKYPYEKLIGGFLSSKPSLLVKDPDLIKNVFVRDFNYFEDRAIGLKTDREPLTKNIVFEKGDVWREIRLKLTPAFSLAKIRNMFPLMIEVSKDFQEYLNDIRCESNIFEVKELSAKFTTDVIGSCLFGIQANSMKDENALFRAFGRQIFEPSFFRLFRLALSQLSPRLFNLFRMRMNTIEEETFFINLVKAVMEARGYKPSSRCDFIDYLIDLKMKGYLEGDKIKITDELLAAQAFAFYLGGFEPSATVIAMASYELAKNQEIQKKLIGEIDEVLIKYNQQITFEALNELPYLKMVISETLRMYPPAMLLNRVCTQSCTLTGTEIKLDEGVLMNIPVYAIHHDPKYYPNPEIFLPERFTTENKDARHPYVYIPFGEGPRACIGLRFALIQNMMGILSILENHKIETNEKTVQKINISSTSYGLCSEEGIYLTITKRKHQTALTRT